jgi:hypothetical protein
MTSDAGALLLGATDRAIRLVDRFAECFADSRTPELIEHTVRTLVGQRVFALALGYEDLVDERCGVRSVRPKDNHGAAPSNIMRPVKTCGKERPGFQGQRGFLGRARQPGTACAANLRFKAAFPRDDAISVVEPAQQ